jgi:DNA-binding NarL/FixJ family response regulator
MTRPPLIVVEASQHAFEVTLEGVARSGHPLVSGWSPGRASGAGPAVARGRAVVCTGTVRDDSDAAAALLAAVGGAGLVIHALGGRDLTDRLVDDLRRLGTVDHRTAEPSERPELPADERELLELLADGRTLGEAAAHLHISRRTADRRLASARARLGVATTAEAVVARLREREPDNR